MSPARRETRLVVGGVPRAELLPPELELEKKARAQRRGLLAVLVLVVVLVGLAYTGVTVATAATQLAVDQANARTAELLAQQAEFIEVRQLQAQVSASEEARRFATSTEVDWPATLDSLAAVAPEGAVNWSGATIVASTPIAPFGASSVPILQPRVAEVTFVGVTRTLPDFALWIERLKTVPGFADATPTTFTNAGDLYTYSMVIHLNEKIYTNRFAVTEEDQG